jgi:hypothetical protein
VLSVVPLLGVSFSVLDAVVRLMGGRSHVDRLYPHQLTPMYDARLCRSKISRLRDSSEIQFYLLSALIDMVRIVAFLGW